MVGLIGKKEGMTQLFNEDGEVVPVTIVKIEDNIIVGKKTEEKDGYNAIVLGAFNIKEKKINKPVKGQFKENIPLKRILKEFRVKDINNYEIGQKIGVETLSEINYIDVIGTSKGKGYQGVIKRHGFSGGPKTHGSKFHRANGSTGQSAFPSRGFKGVKRSGRMGYKKVTSQNHKIYEIDIDKNIIAVKGCIPGRNKEVVFIREAIKKKNTENRIQKTESDK